MYCYKYNFIRIECVLPGIRVQYSGGNHQVLDPHEYTYNPNMLTKYCILYTRTSFARARSLCARAHLRAQRPAHFRAWRSAHFRARRSAHFRARRSAHFRAWRSALGARRTFALGARRLSVTPTFSGAYVHLYSLIYISSI